MVLPNGPFFDDIFGRFAQHLLPKLTAATSPTKCSSTVTWGLGFLHIPYSSKFVTFLLALPWFPVIQEYDRSWETWWMEILAFQSHFSKGLLLLLLTCKLLPKWASQCRLSSQLNPRLSNCPNTHTSPQNLSLEVQYFQSMVSCRAYMMTWYPQNDWMRIWWGHKPGLTPCYWLSIALSQPCGWSWERVHIIFPFLGGIVPAGGWETTGVSTLSSSADENCSKSGSSSTQSSVSDTFSSMSLSKGCAKTSVTVKLFPEGICFREQCTKSKDLEACHGSFFQVCFPPNLREQSMSLWESPGYQHMRNISSNWTGVSIVGHTCAARENSQAVPQEVSKFLC